MQAYEGYVENGQFFPNVSITPTKKKRAVLTVLDEPVKQPQKITLEELLADWDGVPFEKDDEDKAWLEMKPVGREVF
jgi:hypothetical protein